jgi:molybdenum cofactor cytidylyltransferase
MAAAPVGILLAAGRGSRFDPTGSQNKLLARLPDGAAVVEASARNLLAVLPRVIAVVPAEGEVATILRALGCDVTVCADAGQGMAASLVHALRHSLPAARSWVVTLGDMPFVKPATIRALCDALGGGAGIAAPVMQGRRGNPVGFGAAYLQELLALEGDQGARRILMAHPVTHVEVIDPGIFEDIDSAEDLRRPRINS